MNPTLQHVQHTGSPAAARAQGSAIRVVPGASSLRKPAMTPVQHHGLYGHTFGFTVLAKPADWTNAHPDARGLIGS